MNCRDVEEIVTAERGRSPTAELRAALSEHLARCEACRRATQIAGAVFGQAAALPVYPASAGFDAAVVAAATAVALEAPRVRSQRFRLLYFIAGAAASILFVIGFSWLVGLTPEVQASTVLEEAVHHHQESVIDFARSVALLPGAKPDVEIDLVRRDLEDSRLLPRNHELRSLVLVCAKQDRRPLLKVLDDSEQVLGEVRDIVRSLEPPTDALVRVRKVAMTFQAKPISVTVNARFEMKEANVETVVGKPLADFRRARSFYFRGDPVRALPGFQRFRVETEQNADLKPFEGVAVFSLERCEERLGLESGSWQLDLDHAGKQVYAVRLANGSPPNLILEGPQVEQFFVILDQKGLKLDTQKKQIIENALRTVITTRKP